MKEILQNSRTAGATAGLLILILWGSTALAAAANAGSSPTKVLAKVGPTSLTASQLASKDQADLEGANSKLLHARYDLYLAQRNALNDAIDDELLAQAASKAHLSVDDFLKRDVYSKIKDPSDETIRIYYMGTQKPEPYDTARDKIRTYIRNLQEKQAKTEYVAQLRAAQNIQILLEPPHVDLGVGTSPLGGEPTAAVTFVEFADYQCPYCRKTEPELQRLREEFKGKLRYAFRDFPLPMHEFAEKTAEAARCAGKQGEFWPMHDRLFQGDGQNLGVEQLKADARELKLDSKQFDQCLDSGETAAAVKQDLAEGKQLGISGTPSFFINGYYLSGAIPYEMLHEVVVQQIQAASNVRHAAAGVADEPRAENQSNPANKGLCDDKSSRLASADICELPSRTNRPGSGS